MNKKDNIGAFFDFDETLVTVNSAAMGLKWLLDHKMLPMGYILKIFIAKTLYEKHLISEERMATASLTFYKGKRLKDFHETAKVFYSDYLKPYLAPNLLDRMNFHRENGHLLILVSGSLRYYLEPVIKDLNFDHLICSDLEEDEEGILTGRVKDSVNVGDAKLDNTIRFAKEHNIDLQASYAYGNHQADIPLLESVGHPVAVSPTLPLKKVADARNWPILKYEP